MAKESSSVSNIWTQRSLGISLPKNLESELHANVEYLCNNLYPFLQLVNVNAVFTEETMVNFILASTGWIIHDYGEAISASALHGKKPKKKDEASGDGEGGDDGASGGSGGIGDQIITASEIAHLIAEKGWSAVELIAGTKMMQRFIWVESKKYGFALSGYTPDANDEKCYDRLVKNAKVKGLIWEKHVAKKPKNEISGAG